MPIADHVSVHRIGFDSGGSLRLDNSRLFGIRLDIDHPSFAFEYCECVAMRRTTIKIPMFSKDYVRYLSHLGVQMRLSRGGDGRSSGGFAWAVVGGCSVNPPRERTLAVSMVFMLCPVWMVNRFNSGSVDLNRFGNAYSSLLGSDGMTADHAFDILGTANAAMQHMGGTEASQNFTMQAFGNLNPLMARIRAEDGLFGNGLDNKDIGAYVRARGGAD